MIVPVDVAQELIVLIAVVVEIVVEIAGPIRNTQ